MKIKQLPFKQRVSLELSNNFEASLSGWSADYPDPMAYLETMTTGSAQNNTDWGNKEYDQLLKVARTKLALQPNERYENLKKAEEMFLRRCTGSTNLSKRCCTFNKSSSKRIDLP